MKTFRDRVRVGSCEGNRALSQSTYVEVSHGANDSDKLKCLLDSYRLPDSMIHGAFVGTFAKDGGISESTYVEVSHGANDSDKLKCLLDSYRLPDSMIHGAFVGTFAKDGGISDCSSLLRGQPLLLLAPFGLFPFL